jgi:hypothetical protein
MYIRINVHVLTDEYKLVKQRKKEDSYCFSRGTKVRGYIEQNNCRLNRTRNQENRALSLSHTYTHRHIHKRFEMDDAQLDDNKDNVRVTTAAIVVAVAVSIGVPMRSACRSDLSIDLPSA